MVTQIHAGREFPMNFLRSFAFQITANEALKPDLRIACLLTAIFFSRIVYEISVSCQQYSIKIVFTFKLFAIQIFT